MDGLGNLRMVGFKERVGCLDESELCWEVVKDLR